MAVLLVVFAHAGIGFLAGGYVGVDVFFVLSGFLITGLLLAEARKHGSVSLLDFYVRRARRILPAAALTLLATDVAAFYLMNFVRAREAVVDSVHAAGFAANFQFASRGVDYFAQSEPPSPILHYWSLSVEEQFYLVWPLLLSIALFGVALVRRHRAGGERHERRLLGVVVLLAGSSLAWSIYLTSAEPTIAYYSPFTRAWELGLGATLAVGATTIARAPRAAKVVMGWVGLMAILAAAVGFSDGTPFPGSMALVPTIGTALAIVAGTGEGLPRFSVARLLSLRPMLVVGDRSYALYLWHWPVLILAVQYAGYDLSVGVKLGLMAGAFLLSCVSYSLVENPIRRRMRGRAVTAVVVAAFMAGVLGTAAVSLAAVDREEARFEAPVAGAPAVPAGLGSSEASARGGALPAVVAAVQAARRGAPIPQGLTPPIGQLRNWPAPYTLPKRCFSRDSEQATTSKICRLGKSSSRKLIVLLGDSHAMMWLPAVLEMSWRNGWAVVPLLRTGCTPWQWRTNMGRRTCREWYRWALREVALLHPSVTLLGASIDQGETPTTHAAIRGVVATAQTLKRRGRVVVIGDPEGLGWSPVDCLLSRDASMAKCTATWPRAALAPYDEVARRMKQLRIPFLPTRGFVCYERRCPAVVDHTIAWMDDNHLTVLYSGQLGGAFRGAFQRAIPAMAAPAARGRSVAASERAGALPAVVAAVQAARRGAPIPRGLTPPIGQLRTWPARYAPPSGCISSDSQSTTTSRICRLGKSSSRKLIVLLGDSHANMWLPAVLEMAWRDGWALVPLVRTGCTAWQWRTNLGRRTCREWYRWALRETALLHPQITLLAARIDQRETPTTRAGIKGLVATAQTLKRRGRVVVIGDPEGLHSNPVDCLLSRHASMATCTATWPPAALAPYNEISRRMKQLRIPFLPARGFVCYQGRCPAVIGHTIAWMDEDHVSIVYSGQLGGAFRDAFRRAIR